MRAGTEDFVSGRADGGHTFPIAQVPAGGANAGAGAPAGAPSRRPSNAWLASGSAPERARVDTRFWICSSECDTAIDRSTHAAHAIYYGSA